MCVCGTDVCRAGGVPSFGTYEIQPYFFLYFPIFLGVSEYLALCFVRPGVYFYSGTCTCRGHVPLTGGLHTSSSSISRSASRRLVARRGPGMHKKSIRRPPNPQRPLGPRGVSGLSLQEGPVGRRGVVVLGEKTESYL